MKMRLSVLFLLVMICQCSLLPPEKINVEIHFIAPKLIEGVSPKLYIEPATADTFYIYNRIEISNFDIKKAEVFTYHVNPALSLLLTDEGALKVSQFSRVNRGQRLAVLFNKRLIASPIISRPILYGKLIIEGDYSKTQYEQWAKGINRAIGG